MEYHAQKMSEINRTLRELWRATYKGNDIDYIEIRTEAEHTATDEDGAGAAPCAALRRNKFNYRVVCILLAFGIIAHCASYV